ncbi:hypothetical protein I6H88_13645 [Elizabethkingia bruuniana]|uniref:Uncharacterized protein n=1 Tax=Elizabethkingia bruuniana TaxID=1756149 RepID=A0A7T7UWJ7_9FLAO|nr:hypothetical protein [Elizabethkingia bruuniana]KGO08568.1 hypothetical protein KS04_18495 [Elizabethkingia miricola]QDZ63272.1 hypothetical protein EVD20_12345 [Elizabethkingia bruuniana]QQN57487.1 hypothetical protein I6H88_13645 [Elizabethkingia bruuniana]
MSDLDFLKNFDFWAVVIAFIALLWTIITSVIQLKINKQQKIINQNLIKSEGQAILISQIIKLDRYWKIFIVNNGKGKASNINIIYDKEELVTKGIHIMNKTPRKYPDLETGQNIEIVVFTEEWHQSQFTIEIAWDDIETNNTKYQVLEFSES